MTTATHLQALSDAAGPAADPSPGDVVRAIRRRSFAVLSTASPAQRPHAAGVLYEAVGTTLYVNTRRSSRKARNAEANPHVAVVVPIRRLPLGPPATVHFQATADVLGVDDPAIRELLDDGQLGSITGHGELDIPDSCFLRITPGHKLFTYGLGMSLLRFIRDPLNAAGSVDLDDLRS